MEPYHLYRVGFWVVIAVVNSMRIQGEPNIIWQAIYVVLALLATFMLLAGGASTRVAKKRSDNAKP